MGSLDAIHYIRCQKCSGLFQDTETATTHSDSCSGDIQSSACDLVACSKDEYIKYVQPQINRPVRRGRPPRQKPKTPVKVKTPVEPTIKAGLADEEPGQQRRYGLRKGASEAFHLKISSMQRLLGVRGKPAPLPTNTNNSVRPLQKATFTRAPKNTNALNETTDITMSAEPPVPEMVDETVIDNTQISDNPQNDSIVAEESVTPVSLVKVEYVDAESTDASQLSEQTTNVATVVTPTCEVQDESVVLEAPTDDQEPIVICPEASSQSDVMSIEPETDQPNTDTAVSVSGLEHSEEAMETDTEPADPNCQPETEVRESPRLMKKKGKVYKSLSQGPDSSGIYRCNICPYVSKKEGMFRRHMGAHNDGQMYTCEYCNAVFLYRRLYKQHLGTHQGFKCETCAKTFSRRHDLSRHIESTHTGTKKYVCTECDYECRHHHMFTDHLRKHTKDRYVCTHENCQFRTIYRRALMHHLNTVHNSEKHIVCEHCPYKTNDPFAFSKHKKIHTAEKTYACSLCDYKAHSLSYVTAHMTTHKTDKIYHCDTCDYSSVRRTGIRSHMMKHIGVKPWQCPNCEYCATTRTKVQRHIGMRHKGNGQPTRRNIIVRFDLDAYRSDKPQKTPEEQPEDIGSEQPRIEGATERYSATNTPLLGHKYVVIEMVEDADGTALSSNLVGQEVVVQEEPDSEPPPEPQLESGETEENSLCLYKCALCEMTNTSLEVVQEHMATQHSDFIAAEIVDAATASAEDREEMEMPETITITVETDSHMEEVVEEGVDEGVEVQVEGAEVDQGDEVQCVITEATVVHQGAVQALSPPPSLAVQTVTMQDDAVSTAVESILHLQHVPV